MILFAMAGLAEAGLAFGQLFAYAGLAIVVLLAALAMKTRSCVVLAVLIACYFVHAVLFVPWTDIPLDEKPGEPVDSDVVYWNSSFQEFRWVWTGCSVLVFVMGAATVIRIKRKHCLEGRWIELLRPKTNPRANPVLTIEPLGRKTNPRADSVLAKDDYKLEITFTSGEVRVFDCTDVLDFGLFTELRDISYFKQARVESGTVVWPHGQDICPDTLYEGSEELG